MHENVSTQKTVQNLSIIIITHVFVQIITQVRDYFFLCLIWPVTLPPVPLEQWPGRQLEATVQKCFTPNTTIYPAGGQGHFPNQTLSSRAIASSRLISASSSCSFRAVFTFDNITPVPRCGQTTDLTTKPLQLTSTVQILSLQFVKLPPVVSKHLLVAQHTYFLLQIQKNNLHIQVKQYYEFCHYKRKKKSLLLFSCNII